MLASSINHVGHSDLEQDCEGMMAHYLFFLCLVNQYIFYYTACMFAKRAQINPKSGHFKKANLISMFSCFQYPLLSWFCVKYNYHFKITISITAVMTMLKPIMYFYCLLKPEGKEFLISTAPVGDDNDWHCFPGKLNVKLIEQWQSTLLIFISVGQVLNIIGLIQDLSRDDNDRTIPIISSVSMGIILWSIIRGYLHKYVNLDKI